MGIRKPGNDGDKPEVALAEAMLFGGSESIEASEARGQRQMVESEVIPSEGAEKLVDLGFELGDVVKEDPIFRATKLPEGWAREGSGHSMWSYIIDERGFRRVAIFYKAAFYDRHAYASLESEPKTGAQGRLLDKLFETRGYPECDIKFEMRGNDLYITLRPLAKGEDGRPFREDGEWVGSGEQSTVIVHPDGSEEKADEV